MHTAGNKGRFLSVGSAFITATLAFLGCEIVGVTVGEAQNPRRAVPRAVKLTLWRIVSFYIVLVLL
jgi:amino acid transporter